MNTEERNRQAEEAGRNRERRRRGLLTLQELLSRPDPEWLVEGMIPKGGNVVVFGPPAAAKSFLVQGLAMAVVHETEWHGAAVQGGPVVYIAAEGAAGLKKRLRAWMDDHGGEARHAFHCFPEALNFLDEGEVKDLVEQIEALPVPPVLVVVDTLARCMVGGDENTARDMTRFVAACDLIQRATGAAIATVHHTTKDGGDYRGHSSLHGAADAMVKVTRAKDVVTVHCYKQKEAEEFANLTLALIPVGASCVLGKPGLEFGKPDKEQRSVLEAIAGVPEGLRSGIIQESTGLSERKVQKHLADLSGSGLIRTDGPKNSPKRAYLLTTAGRTALDTNGKATTPSAETDGVVVPVPEVQSNSDNSVTTPSAAKPRRQARKPATPTTPSLLRQVSEPPVDTTPNYSVTSSPLGEGDGVTEVVLGQELSDVGHGGARDRGNAPNPNREQRLEADLHTIIEACWPQVVGELKQHPAPITAALLAEAVPVRVDDDALVLRFAYPVLAEKFEQGAAHRERVAQVVQDVTGHRLRVQVEVAAVPSTMN